MDLRQLRYFIAIVECGAFSRAALRLNVAQPALSQHVRAMEAAFGVRLLERSARGVTPTEAGLRLLGEARAIEQRVAGLRDHVRDVLSLPEGDVRLAMPGTIGEQLAVPLIEAARIRFPGVRLRLAEAMSGHVLDMLLSGRAEIALLYGLTPPPGLVMHRAFTEEIKLLAAHPGPRQPRGASIGLARALDLPLIVPGPGHGLRDLLDRSAGTIQRRLTPRIEVDSYHQIKQLVASGLGFGLLPAVALKQELAAGSMRAWSVTEPALERHIQLAHRSGQPLSRAAEAVAGLAWSLLAGMVRDRDWIASWTGPETIAPGGAAATAARASPD